MIICNMGCLDCIQFWNAKIVNWSWVDIGWPQPTDLNKGAQTGFKFFFGGGKQQNGLA